VTSPHPTTSTNTAMTGGSAAAPAVEPGYVFNNDTGEAANQLHHLAAVLDPHTTAVLDHAGVGPGWQCLDVGAGAGSIAGWLADRVGATGHVTATDVKPHHIGVRDNLTVLAHDIRTDEIHHRYDLIHARLLLMHLPQRHEVLARLAAALAPGGTLVVSDWDCADADLVLHSPDPAWTSAFDAFNTTLLDLAGAAGADLAWARHAHSAMRTAGLADVHTDVEQRSWRGGTALCLLHHSNSLQLHAPLRAAGLTDDQLDLLRDGLTRPDRAVLSYRMFTTVGYRH